jgi:hypothetical protein
VKASLLCTSTRKAHKSEQFKVEGKTLIEQETITIVVASLGTVGTLGGIAVGNFLSRSSQMEQWMRDRRYEEFKELLGGLAEAMFAEVEITYQSEKFTAEELRAKSLRCANFFMIVQTRIFTFRDVQKLGLKREWLAAVNHHRAGRPHDLGVFEKKYQLLVERLVDAATSPKAKNR